MILDPLHLPHRAARALLAEGHPVWLPVNPVEYHGPHLSLHNDHLLATAVAARTHAALGLDGPLCLTADLEVGVHPTEGPGSRHCAVGQVAAAVEQATLRLADLGARAIVLATFHGAPLHAIALDRGAAAARARGVQVVDPFLWVVAQGVQPDADAIEAAVETVAPDAADTLRASLPTDVHAGFFETSLALALAPDAVAADHRALPPCPPVTRDPALMQAASLAERLGRDALAGELRFAAFGRAWQGLRPFPGYTGHPAWANPDAGRLIADRIVAEAAARLPAALAGAPPRPGFRWLYALTLGGRLPAA